MFTCNADTIFTCIWYYSWWALDGDDYSLPAFNIDPATITMSGFSSGSYMSANMHVVFSDLIKGVGLIAGGPYGLIDMSVTLDANGKDTNTAQIIT